MFYCGLFNISFTPFLWKTLSPWRRLFTLKANHRTSSCCNYTERTLLSFCTLKLCKISWAQAFLSHYGKKKPQINTSIAAAPCRQHLLTTLGVHHTEARGCVLESNHHLCGWGNRREYCRLSNHSVILFKLEITCNTCNRFYLRSVHFAQLRNWASKSVTEESRNLNVEEARKFLKSKVSKLSGFYMSSRVLLPSKRFQEEVRNSLRIYKEWIKVKRES